MVAIRHAHVGRAQVGCLWALADAVERVEDVIERVR